MSDFRIDWSIEGEQQLSRRLIGLGTGLRDYQKPFNRSANMLQSLFSNEVFDTQGAVIGEQWKRLSPYTVAQKARRGLPIVPLQSTGRMRRSFKTQVSTDQAVIYNTAEYFKFHQSKAPRSRLPRRVMMKLGILQREQIIKVFQAYIQEILKAS